MYFHLFADCLTVKGYTRSTICDLSRGKFHLIPNELFGILTALETQTIESLLGEFDLEDKETLQDYLDFLVKNEFGFLAKDRMHDSFPKLDYSFFSPGKISNAIIDINEFSTHNYELVFEKLQKVSCKALQLRFYTYQNKESIEYILDCGLGKDFESIELVLLFSDELRSFLIESSIIYPITQVYFHSCPESYIGTNPQIKTSGINFHYTTTQIKDHHYCGVVSPSYFVSNFNLFIEGQQHNSCLNKKVGISINGDVKNCPSMPESFGYINEIDLESCVSTDEFQKYWNIPKSIISICQDCEFRYVCTDCRAFLQDEKNIYSKPAKCKYDPYSATWEAP